MELDINPEWVSFAVFTHPAGTAHGLSGSNLFRGVGLTRSLPASVLERLPRRVHPLKAVNSLEE